MRRAWRLQATVRYTHRASQTLGLWELITWYACEHRWAGGRESSSATPAGVRSPAATGGDNPPRSLYSQDLSEKRDAHSDSPYNSVKSRAVWLDILNYGQFFQAKYASLSNPPGSCVYNSSATADTSKQWLLCPTSLTVGPRTELRKAGPSEKRTPERCRFPHSGGTCAFPNSAIAMTKSKNVST